MLVGGTATGVGSLPGTDITEAVTETFGELPELPYLPELPARGPGSEMIGRSASLLVDMPVEVYAGHWRVAARSGLDLRRARDFLQRDLDVFTERADGYSGPLKVQSAGPWTLAAGLELALGEGFLSDHGAVRDLAASLQEGLRLHVAEVRRRIPGAEVLLQLDEPSLPAVLSGRVPTASGLHTYRSVASTTSRDTLASLVEGVGAPVIVHCCAPNAPITMFREAGATGLSLDLSTIEKLDPLGEAIDAGLSLFAGVAPASGVSAPAASTLADRVKRLWSELGFPLERLLEQVALTPSCGLAGATPAYATAVLKACHEAARQIADS